MLGWLVYEHGVEPHVTVFDKSARKDGTFSRDDFTYDHERDVYRCPGGTTLPTTGTLVNDGATMLYRAPQHECTGCALKPRCCPNTPARKVQRSIHEGARDMARQIAKSCEGGRKIALFTGRKPLPSSGDGKRLGRPGIGLWRHIVSSRRQFMTSLRKMI
jgi:hypothetical protein